MKKRFTVPLLALCVAAALVPRGVQASAPRIPATAYPAGAHISYRAALSNADMDCVWGFVCELDMPLFHLYTQDGLHRTAGWAQFAGMRRHGRMVMAFQLFASHYDATLPDDNTPWSKSAFDDLRAALTAQGYVEDRHNISLLATDQPGGRLIAVQRVGRQDLVVMASWSGTHEIEGIAAYDHKSQAARQTAWSCLALQIQIASARGT